MRTRILFISVLALCACSGRSGNQNGMIQSFQLTVWDNCSNGKIDNENKTISVKHIPNGESVTGVICQLVKGAIISPDPESLIGKWPLETVFTITKGAESVDYKVIMEDYTLDAAPANWKLIWNEEFNDGKIDYDVWSKTPRGTGNWHDMMSDDESLYEFSDGALILWGKKNPDTSIDSSTYLTGGIWGKDKKSFSLGRVDVRAKIDDGQGFWPAIWFLPQGNEVEYSGGGEIDLVEHLNYDDFVYQTLHTRYTNLINKENPKNHVKSPADMDEFNVYSVEVFSDKVNYLVNNEIMFTYPRLDEEGQFPFPINDYYAILSAQLGGNWVGEINIDHPVRLIVDYVRVYGVR